jgi:hypothetical protein
MSTLGGKIKGIGATRLLKPAETKVLAVYIYVVLLRLHPYLQHLQ